MIIFWVAFICIGTYIHVVGNKFANEKQILEKAYHEYLDLKKDYFADRGGKPLGSDKGRFNASGREEDMHRFKVPNLRNVELTHPYLHDGTVTTLDEAVRIMGVYCSGLDVPQKDRALIVGFLRTLTGRHEGRPVQGEAVAR